MIHTQAARKWQNEQRKKWLRRQIWHAQEILGAVLWGVAAIIGVACLIFILGNR